VLLILGTNKQPSKTKLTNIYNGNLHGLLLVLHRSDRCPALIRPVTPLRRWTEPVRPVATAAAQQVFQRASVTSLGPGTRTLPKHNLHRRKSYTKPSKTTPNRPRTDQQHHDPKHMSQVVHPRQIPQVAYTGQTGHTPVRPVKPGQLGMNSTRRSTPPNPNLDLPNHSTDLCKTLGIVGTPHGESIAKIFPTKTRQDIVHQNSG
jgi:hypothetical protein